MKKILITGSAGFIGSNLCDRFLKDGFFVFGMDNLITGSIKNISHLNNNSNFEFIEQDVIKHITIKDKLDFIFHFASPASPIDYLKYQIQTLKANAIGGHNTLGLAKKNEAKYILASTSEVYGDPLIHPQKENYYGNVNPIGPRSIYDESKRFSESMAIAYHNYHKLNVSIVRIFNTYGPRMRIDDGRVLPTFISQAYKNENITINGDGKQTRSFCYIDDLINGITLLMKSDYAYPVNIGNNDEVFRFLIIDGTDSLEMTRNDSTWTISQADTLIIKNNQIEKLFDRVLQVKKEVIVSKNPEKWSTFGVTDSLGKHFSFFDKDNIIIGSYIFGNEGQDYQHNYIRDENESDVFRTNDNIYFLLNSSPTYWGKNPPKPEINKDSIDTTSAS